MCVCVVHDGDIDMCVCVPCHVPPMQGLSIRPLITLQIIGACRFRWYRLPLPPAPPDMSHRDGNDDDNDDDGLRHDRGGDADSGCNTDTHGGGAHILPPSPPISSSPDVVTVDAKLGGSSARLVQETGDIEMREIGDSLDRDGLDDDDDDVGNLMSRVQILSQSAHYVPTQSDVGHRLMFVVSLIIPDQSGVSVDRHIVTDVCIPTPSSPPRRTWVENPNAVNQRSKTKQIDWSPPIVGNALPIADISKRYSAGLYAPGDIDTTFSLLSYNTMAEGYLKSLYGSGQGDLLRQLFPNCPSYALSYAYRKKVLLNELIIYGVDLICLQALDHRDYDSMHLEMSKLGYSSIYAECNPKPEDHESPSQRSGAVTESKLDQYGLCTMYRRSKFSKIRDWQLNFSDCVSEFQSRSQTSSVHGRVWSVVEDTLDLFDLHMDDINLDGHLAVVSMFELKDYFMMAMDNDGQSRQDGGKLLVVNVMLHRPHSDAILDGYHRSGSGIKTQVVQLVHMYLLLQKLRMTQETIDALHVPVVIAGDLSNGSGSLVYEYLSHGSITDTLSSLVQQQAQQPIAGLVNSSLPGDASQELLPQNSYRSDRLATVNLSNTGDRTAMFESMHKLTHDFAFHSCYMETMRAEPEYRISDGSRSAQHATEFIWVQKSHMHVRKVAKSPLSRKGSNSSVPSVHYASAHIALLCELELYVNVSDDGADETEEEVSSDQGDLEEEEEEEEEGNSSPLTLTFENHHDNTSTTRDFM